MKRMLFIVNPRSGKAQIKNRLLEVLDVFSKAGYQMQIHITQRQRDAKEIVASQGEDFDLVVCSGGDGTLNETISGLMELSHPPAIGYIPTGSTNDFAASLKIPKQVLEAAETAVYGSDYPIDIGCFGENQYFVYVAGFGVFTEISYLTPQEKKNMLGHQAYMLESVKSLTSMKSYHVRIVSDEIELEGEFIFGMITNTISVGGFKSLVSQDVALNDGLFEVMLIRTPKTPLELSNIVASLFMKEEHNEFVYKFKTKSLQIVSTEEMDWVLDGEFGGRRSEVFVENLYQRIQIRRLLP